MMSIKSPTLWFGCLLLAGSVWAHSDRPAESSAVTLEGLYRACLVYNPDLKAAAETVETRRMKIRSTKAARLPRLQFTGVYTRIGVVPEFDIPGYDDLRFVSPNSVNFTLQARYTLFDWGMGADRVAMERFGLRSELLNSRLLKKNLLLQITLTYLNILELQDSLALTRKNRELLDDIMALMRSQFKAGLIPEHQLLQTRSQIQSVEGRRLEMERLKEELISALKQVSGLPPSRAIRLIRPEIQGPELDGGVKALLETAQANREDFKLLNLQLRILETSRRIIGKSRLPVLTASLSAELRNGIMPDVEELRTNWSAGLTVVASLFDGNVSTMEKRAIEHDIRALKFTLESRTRDLRDRLWNLIRRMETIESKAEVGRLQLITAQKGLDLSRRAFRESQATYLDVLNARSGADRAENNLLSLDYEKRRIEVQLLFEIFALDHFVAEGEEQ